MVSQQHGRSVLKLLKSEDSGAVVFALIRSQNTAGPLNDLARLRKNVHVIETDISDPTVLKRTSQQISQVTGGSLDIVIYNAYLAGTEAMQLTPSGL